MKTVLAIGGHGVLGRPVVRRLVRDGFSVRVMARRPEKARAALPPPVEVVEGDLQSLPSLEAALRGCDAVYLSVDTLPGAKFRPETDGLKHVALAAAKARLSPRLLVLSALGSSDPRAETHPWWHVREKAAAQRMAKVCDLPWTLFEPTWFMESIPLFIQFKSFMEFSGTKVSPHWISGDDYGRMVSAALSKDIGQGEIVPVQGPDKIPMGEAADRFMRVYDGSLRRRKVPLWLLTLAGVFNAQAKDLGQLLKHYSQYDEPAPDPAVWERYARPEMTLEGYAHYVRAAGNFPSK